MRIATGIAEPDDDPTPKLDEIASLLKRAFQENRAGARNLLLDLAVTQLSKSQEANRRHVGARLAQLAGQEPQTAEVAALKFFLGLPEEEIAGMLGLATRTVKREWHRAKGWLAQS